MKKLIELPYSMTALQPAFSQETMEFHYGKHHANYVKNLNQLISGSELESLPLSEIVKKAYQEKNIKVFNNAAQAWNHNFYWYCLTPSSDASQASELVSKINQDFGSLDLFKEQFSAVSTSVFGSGWAWLVLSSDDKKLKIVATKDADSPLCYGQTPLLTCDIWEHAYYIDYRNDRAAYIKAFWDVVDWKFVQNCLLDTQKTLSILES